jgi:hypothetical protein
MDEKIRDAIGRELIRALARDEVVQLGSIGSLLMKYKGLVELRVGLGLPICIPRGVKLKFVASNEFLEAFIRGNNKWFGSLKKRRLKPNAKS